MLAKQANKKKNLTTLSRRSQLLLAGKVMRSVVSVRAVYTPAYEPINL